jgi:molybdenum cofactor cytidylyltransferase
MKFGPTRLAEAEGGILAHAVATPGGTLRKGTRLTPDMLEKLQAAAIDEVIAARLEPGDVHEDEAAHRLAAALAGPGVTVEEPATGRSNLFARHAGLLAINVEAVDAVNRIHPSITLATRPALRGVEAGRMVATVKIIPFAVPEALLQEAVDLARASLPVIEVERYLPLDVAVVSTLLPTLKPSVVDKTVRVLAARMAPAGARVTEDIRVPHDEASLASALARIGSNHDLTIIFGASAVVDEGDVIPAAIERAGGEVLHVGMPVDPGNLLIIGTLGGKPVLGAPGCARSPRENGFDFVLERILAGRAVSAEDIMGMGVGGLLMDIVSRPEPRSGEARRENPDAPKVAAVVLAAGQATRFGGDKMTAPYNGKPLVRIAAEAALGATSDVIVVTGHRSEAVEAALAGLPVTITHNPDYALGQSTSVQAGLRAVPDTCEAAVILLGDMPLIGPADVEKVIAAYRPMEGSLVVVATFEGRRGNPVLWSRRFFSDLMAIEGDQGGRALIAKLPEAVTTVELGAAAAFDVDTPDALKDGA